MLTQRFGDALILAFELHGTQYRKGTQIPYFAHLMAVASLVMEFGGDEDQAIAALLHDAVEDQGGLATLALIREKFGDYVAGMVDECSDSFVLPKPPWRERKARYLERVKTISRNARLITLADKLHNARTILAELEIRGDKVWEKFNGGKDGSLWYYRSMANFFLNKDPGFLARELDQVVRKLEEKARDG